MKILRLATVLMAGAATGSAAADEGFHSMAGVRIAQVTMREQVIIRVRTLAPQRAPRGSQYVPSSEVKWREKKAPRCLALRDLAGISNIDSESIDLVLRGGSRVRAKLDDDCPSLDFYQGFYFKPTEDGKMCADRDSIHSRSGAQCEIARFRMLVPDR